MKKIFLLISLTILILSCNEGPIENTEPSSDSSIKQFQFIGDANGKFGNPAVPTQVENFFYITIPKDTDIKTLIPKFTVHEKATVNSLGKDIVSEQSSIDCSGKTVKMTIKAENGQTRTLELVVKIGDQTFDQKVYEFMKTYTIPGISISVIKNRNTIYSYGYGFANKNTKERMTNKHLLRLASVSKQFTSICVMSLVQDGKFSIDQPLFGPEGLLGEKYADVTGKAATVTARNFLQHNSGWTSNPDPMFTNAFDGHTLDELIDYMLGRIEIAGYKCEMVTNPGTKYSYYNLGFGVLQKLIEKYSGKPYEEYLREIMAKAGLNDVWVGKGYEERRKNESVCYSQSGTNGYANEMDVIAAAGGVIASSYEMMTLLTKVDRRTDIPDILSKEILDEMYTPSPVYSRYGLGWRVGHPLFPDAHYHSGNIAGTATLWTSETSNGVGGAILCNSRSYIDGFDDSLYILLSDLVTHNWNSWSY